MVCLSNSEGHEFVNLLEDDNALKRWRDFINEQIEECENVYQLYLMINNLNLNISKLKLTSSVKKLI